MAASLLPAACGRKTNVRPPELVVPNPVEGLTADNAEQGIDLAWDRPTRYADGSNMLDLAGFRIERSRPCCGFVTLQEVEVEDRNRFRRAKRFRYTDHRVEVGEIYAYRVTAYTLDGYESTVSETVEIRRELPAAKP